MTRDSSFPRNYHPPTEVEREFLRIVTRGYLELEHQTESCEISEYDATGWCYVPVLDGPPSPIQYRYPADGPRFLTGDSIVPFVETLLWTNDAGMLAEIEIIEYGDSRDDPYRVFAEAAVSVPPGLRYRNSFTDKRTR